jgi:acyl-CoA thioester hydrolase
VKLGDPLLVETQLVDADTKRLHIFHRMRHADQGFLAATTELLALHVDLAGPRAAPFPAETQAGIAALLAEHRRLPPPPQLGRSISIKRRG